MDIVNSEKIEETFGINGYYGDGQMMNWFAPPTTIQNVRGVDYESTPHGVPTDEFWWIKQNRYNRERIANNLKNTTVIYPTALPSGDRLEDDYFNAEGDKSDDKILGMPKMVAIGVGVVILAIGGFIVYKKFIKK
jgi:hypothetical protein